MKKNAYDWEGWGARFRREMKANGSSLRKLATRKDAVGAESTLRSYTNNIRDISLREFFALCEQIGADPHDILFGPLALTVDQTKALGDAVAQTIGNLRQPKRRQYPPVPKDEPAPIPARKYRTTV